MSNYQNLIDGSNVFVPASNVDAMIKEYISLIGDKDVEVFKNSGLISLWEGLWELAFDETGCVTEVYYNGNGFTIYDEIFTRVLAKYANNNSYLWMEGEGNDQWRWYFVGGKCIEIYPQITWSYDSACATVFEKYEPKMGFVQGAWVEIRR